jgi:hypothetical protein
MGKCHTHRASKDNKRDVQQDTITCEQEVIGTLLHRYDPFYGVLSLYVCMSSGSYDILLARACRDLTVSELLSMMFVKIILIVTCEQEVIGALLHSAPCNRSRESRLCEQPAILLRW